VSAILRATGKSFDVNAFLAHCPWSNTKIFHRGDPRPPRKHALAEKPALNVPASNADLDQFPAQLHDATHFLTAHQTEIQRLVAFPGVESVTLDFAIARPTTFTHSVTLPAALIHRAAACGISLQISHYPLVNGDSSS
jgi:hypothetical protein